MNATHVTASFNKQSQPSHLVTRDSQGNETLLRTYDSGLYKESTGMNATG